MPYPQVSALIATLSRFHASNAPTVPVFGTEGALSPSKRYHRPVFWDRRSTSPIKTLPPSQFLGQKEHFPYQNATTVPFFGTEGALPHQNAPTVPVLGTEGALSPPQTLFYGMFKNLWAWMEMFHSGCFFTYSTMSGEITFILLHSGCI